MELDKKIYYSNLFDLYSNLLTEHQKEIFSYYYFDDLSLAEISEIKNVSRNAVFILIHKVENSLKEFENKLKFYSKLLEMNDILENNKVDKKIIDKINKVFER